MLCRPIGEVEGDVDVAGSLHIHHSGAVRLGNAGAVGGQAAVHGDVVGDESAAAADHGQLGAVNVFCQVREILRRHGRHVPVQVSEDLAVVHAAGYRGSVVQLDVLVGRVQLHLGNPDVLGRLHINGGGDGIEVQGVGGGNIAVHGLNPYAAVFGDDLHTGLDILQYAIHRHPDVEVLVGPEDLGCGRCQGVVRVGADNVHIAIQVDGEPAAQDVPGLGVDIAGAVVHSREADLHIHPVGADVAAARRQVGRAVFHQVTAGLEGVSDAVAVGVHVVVRHQDTAVGGSQCSVGVVHEPHAVPDLNVSVGGDFQGGVVRQPAVKVVPRAYVQQHLGLQEVGGEDLFPGYLSVAADPVEVAAPFQNQLSGVLGHVAGLGFVVLADVQAVNSLIDVISQIRRTVQFDKSVVFQPVPDSILLEDSLTAGIGVQDVIIVGAVHCAVAAGEVSAPCLVCSIHQVAAGHIPQNQNVLHLIAEDGLVVLFVEDPQVAPDIDLQPAPVRFHIAGGERSAAGDVRLLRQGVLAVCAEAGEYRPGVLDVDGIQGDVPSRMGLQGAGVGGRGGVRLNRAVAGHDDGAARCVHGFNPGLGGHIQGDLRLVRSGQGLHRPAAVTDQIQVGLTRCRGGGGHAQVFRRMDDGIRRVHRLNLLYDGAAVGAGHIQLGLSLSRNAIGYSDASRRLDVRVGFAAGGDGSEGAFSAAGNVGFTVVGYKFQDFHVLIGVELGGAAAGAVMVVHAQVGQVQRAVGADVRCAPVDDPQGGGGDVHRLVRVLAYHLVDNAVYDDVIRCQGGVFRQFQVGVHRDDLGVVGALHMDVAGACVDNQRILRVGADGGAIALGDDGHIAAVGTDVFSIRVRIAVYQSRVFAVQADNDFLILPFHDDGADGIPGGIIAGLNLDIRLCAAGADYGTVGLGYQLHLGHFVAHDDVSAALCIVPIDQGVVLLAVDNQIIRAVVTDGDDFAAASGVRLGDSCLMEVSVSIPEPVSALDIPEDFVGQTLQLHLLALIDADIGRVVQVRSFLVQDGVGLLGVQKFQFPICILRQHITHLQVQLSVVEDHAVDVVIQFPELSQAAEGAGLDVVRGVDAAVILGGEGDLVFPVDHQIDCQTALGQIQVIGDPVSRSCFSRLGVFGNGNRLQRNGPVFNGDFIGACLGCRRVQRNRPVDGNHGAASVVVGAAYPQNQLGIASVQKGNVVGFHELDRALGSRITAVGAEDQAVCEGSSIRVHQNFLAVKSHDRCGIVGQIFVLGIVQISLDSCFAVEQSIAVAAVKDRSVLMEGVRGFIQPVELPILRFGIVIQRQSFIDDLISTYLDTHEVQLRSTSFFVLAIVPQRRIIGGNGFVAGLSQFCIADLIFLSYFGLGNGLEVVFTVTLLHNGDAVVIGNDHLFCLCGDIHRSHDVAGVPVFQDDLSGLVGIAVGPFFNALEDGFLRNQGNGIAGQLRIHAGAFFQFIKHTLQNRIGIAEGHRHVAHSNGIDVMIHVFLLHEDHLGVRRKVLAGVPAAVRRVLVEHILLAIHCGGVLLAAGVVFQCQRGIGRQQLGIAHRHAVAVHGEFSILVTRCQHILGQEIDADELPDFSVGPGVFRQREGDSIVGSDFFKITTILVVGFHRVGNLPAGLGVEEPGGQLSQERSFRIGQIGCGRSGGIAQAIYQNQGDVMASAYQSQLGLAVHIFQGDGAARVQEVLKGEDHIGILPCHVQVVGRLLGFPFRIRAVNGPIRTVVCGAAGHKLEVIPVVRRIYHALSRSAEGEQVQRVGVLVVAEDVVRSVVAVGQILEQRLQAGEAVIRHVSDFVEQLRPHVPFHHILFFELFSLGIIRLTQTDDNVFREVAAGEEVRRRIDHGEQHVEGSILLNVEVAAFQVNPNAVAQPDGGHLAVFLIEGVVTHGHGGVIFLDPADVVVGIHPEYGAVGQLVAVQSGGCVILVPVAIQNIQAVDGTVAVQRYLLGLIAERSGHRDGNEQSVVLHGNVLKGAQGQVHIALSGADSLYMDRSLRVAAGAVFQEDHCRGHVQEDVSLSGCLNPGGFLIIGSKPCVHRVCLGADGGGIENVQPACPDGRVFHLGAGIGNLLHRCELAAGFSGPFHGDAAVVQEQEALHMHVAGSAGNHPKRCRFIGRGLSVVRLPHAVHIHRGLDIAAVAGEDLVQNHLPVGVVGDGYTGNPGLIVD